MKQGAVLKKADAARSAMPPVQLLDARFRALVGEEGWARLPQKVRRRFSRHLGLGQVAIYRGKIVEAALSPPGWLLAQLVRPLGAPLPLSSDVGVCAVVSVSEDAQGGGQVWSRLYARRDALPQVIHSAKRFAGPSGLEEHIGGGFGMALKVEALADGLRFVADHYFWAFAGRRWRLPRWMAPGRCVVEHRDKGEGAFDFILSLDHPLFGRLAYQKGAFRDG